MNYAGKEDDYWPTGHKVFIFNCQVDTLEYPEKSLSEGLESSDWPVGMFVGDCLFKFNAMGRPSQHWVEPTLGFESYAV